MWKTGFAAGALALTIGQAAFAAGNVTLTDAAKGFSLSGDIIGFNGESYSVFDGKDIQNIAANGITCEGAGCPPAKFSIAEAPGYPGLLQALIESFVITLDFDVAQSGDTINISKNNALIAEIDITTGDDASMMLASQISAADTSTQLLAFDALVALGAPVGPRDGLTAAQVGQIASGQLNSWAELGGADVAINLHAGPIPAGAVEVAAEWGWQVPEGVATISHPRMRDAADAAANDPYGIAIMPRSQTRAGRALALNGACGISTTASSFNVNSGTYQMTYPLWIKRSAQPMPWLGDEFLGFLDGEFAVDVLQDFGLVAPQISVSSLNQEGQRIANAVLAVGEEVPLQDVQELTQMMSGASRLSATFRFRSGSTTLDAASRTVVNRLAEAIILGTYADKVIHLAGFSDAAGAQDVNKKISAQRATAVKEAILAAAPAGMLDDVNFEIAGYGEASPLVCTDAPNAADLNRRVEVWIKDRPADAQ